MTNILLNQQAQRFIRKGPDMKPGYTVRVHERIQEGDKERTQIFEGLVISVHNGHVPTDASFTVRRIVSGIGVEKVFPLHSPSIEKIEVKKVAKTRRAKLFFIRNRSGKAARMIERFTTDGEFGSGADKATEEDILVDPVVASEIVEPAAETPAEPTAEAPANAE